MGGTAQRNEETKKEEIDKYTNEQTNKTSWNAYQITEQHECSGESCGTRNGNKTS